MTIVLISCEENPIVTIYYPKWNQMYAIANLRGHEGLDRWLGGLWALVDGRPRIQ